MTPLRLTAISMVVAGTICGPDAMAQQSLAAPPPPPGFGEPLNPGPYVFFVDYRRDWAEIVESVKGVIQLLPASVWQLCYVQSFDASKRRADKEHAQAQLEKLLRTTGMAKLDIVPWEHCKMDPRELDALHLVIISGNGG